MRCLYLQCQRNASDASRRGRRRYHHSEWPSASSLSRRRSVITSGFARISTETAPARSTRLLRCGIDAASQHRHRIDGRRCGAMAMLAALSPPFLLLMQNYWQCSRDVFSLSEELAFSWHSPDYTSTQVDGKISSKSG